MSIQVLACLQKMLNILDGLALCSDDNDNGMTFVRQYSLFALPKSCNCPIYIVFADHLVQYVSYHGHVSYLNGVLYDVKINFV